MTPRRVAAPLALVMSAAALVVSTPAAAVAAPQRFAVIVGANLGDRNDVALRYAEMDAQRIADTLRMFGDFPADQILLLSGVTGSDVRDALIRLNARLREQAAGTLLFVYYSGHADQDGLRLNGTTLPLDDLRALVVGSSAETRVLVVDACRSGSATRVKGAHPVPAFDVILDSAPPPRGVAILTSSTAGEDSQESDVLRASFFTHFFNSALIGAGDQNADGRITLGEAFAFASEQTVLATMRTVAGPQHPTYRVEMGGRQDLVLTHPRNAHVPTGTLTFSEPGRYFVHRLETAGGPAPVAEVVASRPGAHVQVAPGRYLVSSRGDRQLLESEHRVDPGRWVAISRGEMRRFEYARMVRKGGAETASVWSAGVAAGGHTDLLHLGSGFAGALGVRVDRAKLALEARLSFQRGTTLSAFPALDFETNVVAATLLAVRPFDVGPLTIGLGVEVGAAAFDQRVSYRIDGSESYYYDYDSPPRTLSFGAVGGPVLQLEAPLPERFSLRVEAGLPTFATGMRQWDGSTQLSRSTQLRATAGLGFYF
jgi:hypothetical protein